MSDTPKVYTADEKALLKRTFLAKGTDDDVELFVKQCERTGLDPFTRQIYATFRWDKDAEPPAYKMSVQATIDGFRVVASRSGDYAGQSGPFWCGSDGDWKDVWLADTPPSAAKVGVSRKGFVEPLNAVGLWEEYKQTKKSGGVAYMWDKMSALMLAKCAEALALRKAFPNDLSGIYSTEEMAQADNEPPAPVDSPKVEPTPPKPDKSIVIGKLMAEIEALGDNGAAAVKEICSGEPYNGLTVESMDRDMGLKLYRDLETLKKQLTTKEAKE